MNMRRNFEIAFVGLKPGIHEFEYEIDDKFFAEFQQQDFRHCVAHVKLTLDKNNGFMLLKFEVGGKLEVTCDRCGNELPMELWDEFNIVVKMVEDPELMNDQEEDPDVYYISRGESIFGCPTGSMNSSTSAFQCNACAWKKIWVGLTVIKKSLPC